MYHNMSNGATYKGATYKGTAFKAVETEAVQSVRKNMFMLANSQYPFNATLKYTPKVWSEDEIAAKLENYVEVPREYWGAIETQCVFHATMVKVDGKFNGGGYIYRMYVKEGEELFCFMNQKVQGDSSFTWSVRFAEIQHLYLRKNILVSIQSDRISALDKKVGELEHQIKSLLRKKKAAHRSAAQPP